MVEDVTMNGNYCNPPPDGAGNHPKRTEPDREQEDGKERTDKGWPNHARGDWNIWVADPSGNGGKFDKG